jgi:hypothetical protein
MNSRRIGNTSAGTLRINSLDVHDINRALTAIGMRLDNLQGIGQVPIHSASSGTKTTGAAPSTGSSTAAKAASTAAAASVPPAHPPTPTGLQTELGNTTYRGRDLELTWDDVRNPELYEFTANERFRDYLVEARTNAGAKLREVAVASEKFVYTRDQMVKDGLTDRSFSVRIWARDLDGNLSDTPGKITVSKELPTLTGQAPAITATSKGIDVDLSGLAHNAENVDQWKILIDTVNPPVAVARIVPENTKHVFWPKENTAVITYYVRVVPVDYFGDGIASDVASTAINPWSGAGAKVGTNLFDSLGDVLDDVDVVTGKFVTGPEGTNRIAIYKHEADGYIAGINASNVIQAQLRASDGRLVAGGGVVLLDVDGLSIESSTVDDPVANGVKWRRGSVTQYNEYHYTGSTFSIHTRKVFADGARNSFDYDYVYSDYKAYRRFYATVGGKTATLSLKVENGVSELYYGGDEFNVTIGGLPISISRMNALTATVAGSIGATYTPFEQSVLVNLRTRMSELETRMQGKGWLS